MFHDAELNLRSIWKGMVNNLRLLDTDITEGWGLGHNLLIWSETLTIFISKVLRTVDYHSRRLESLDWLSIISYSEYILYTRKLQYLRLCRLSLNIKTDECNKRPLLHQSYLSSAVVGRASLPDRHLCQIYHSGSCSPLNSATLRMFEILFLCITCVLRTQFRWNGIVEGSRWELSKFAQRCEIRDPGYPEDRYQWGVASSISRAIAPCAVHRHPYRIRHVRPTSQFATRLKLLPQSTAELNHQINNFSWKSLW